MITGGGTVGTAAPGASVSVCAGASAPRGDRLLAPLALNLPAPHPRDHWVTEVCMHVKKLVVGVGLFCPPRSGPRWTPPPGPACW